MMPMVFSLFLAYMQFFLISYSAQRIFVCIQIYPLSIVAPMSFPTQEWQTKLSKQIEENQKVLEQFEAICESRKVYCFSFFLFKLWMYIVVGQ